MLPESDLSALQFGSPIFTEDLASDGYSRSVFEQNELLRLTLNDTGRYKLVRDYFINGRFGNEYFDNLSALFDADEDGAALAQYQWKLGGSATAANFTLAKGNSAVQDEYALRIDLDTGTDDEIRALLSLRTPLSLVYRPMPVAIPANLSLMFNVHSVLRIVIDATNNKLDFTEGVTGAAVATIASGEYTWAGLATAIQTALNAAATDNTYTVDFNSTVSDKFSIVRATGTATISLNWNTGPNAAASIGPTIGFLVAADDTGATTYSADNEKFIANGLQYQLRQELKTPTYWNGTIWTTASWIDITGVDAEGTFTDAVTSDAEVSTYSLALRPKGAYTGVVAYVSSIGIHDAFGANDGGYFGIAGEPVLVHTPARSRVGVIAASGGKELVIERLGVNNY